MVAQRVIEADPASPRSIQRGVAALESGGLVYMPPGSFCIDETIELRSGVALVGAGPDATTICLAPGSNCHIFTNSDHQNGNSDMQLRGFSLDGNMSGQHRPPDARGVTFACGGYFKRVTGLLVDDVVARSIRQTAFHFTQCSKVEVRHLVADEMGWSGVSTSGTDDIVIREVVVTDAGLDVRHSGLHLDGGRGGYVDAVVDGCTGNGIMLDSTFSPLSDYVVRAVARRSMRGLSLSGDLDNELTSVCVTGDYSENRETGVLVSNASHIFVIDATIVSNLETGIVVQGRAGSRHCVVAGCRIGGSPQLVHERDGNHVAYMPAVTLIAPSHGTELKDGKPLTVESTPPDPPRSTAAPSARRLRRVARAVRRAASVSRASTNSRSLEVAESAPTTVDDDRFDGTCNVCGERQLFVRHNKSLREGYRCARCKASLRYRGQAGAIIRHYTRESSTSIADLVQEREFTKLSLWEPGVLGPFRQYFRQLPGYVMSDFWPDTKVGDVCDGVRCEDLMALTFAAETFDLVVTSDIFEHVRKPQIGFAEVHRVLRPGGRHIFSIPVQDPMPAATIERVDTSTADDVFVLEPRYHLGPGNSQHIVYNDFGSDLLGRLDDLGFDNEVVRFEAPSRQASRLLTFCSVKRQ